LFGPRSYDAFAIDIWSLGTTFAEFFTSLKLNRTDHDEYGDDEDEDADEDVDEIPYAAFRTPRSICPGEKTFWSREPLFNAERGEIGLAWSIFKVMGTPNEENWPVNPSILLYIDLLDDMYFRNLQIFRIQLALLFKRPFQQIYAISSQIFQHLVHQDCWNPLLVLFQTLLPNIRWI
jgi:serine/threonine protein kinase